MAKLKPCPFCGQPVSILYNSLDDAFKFYHKADAPCPVVEPMMLKGISLADAAQKWNRRAGDKNLFNAVSNIDWGASE